jgi:hypothetical protein
MRRDPTEGNNLIAEGDTGQQVKETKNKGVTRGAGKKELESTIRIREDDKRRGRGGKEALDGKKQRRQLRGEDTGKRGKRTLDRHRRKNNSKANPRRRLRTISINRESTRVEGKVS